MAHSGVGHVSGARLTRIMNLLNLAPDIQEQLLHLHCVERGRDPVTERDLRPIAAVADWGKQRRMWRALTVSKFSGGYWLLLYAVSGSNGGW